MDSKFETNSPPIDRELKSAPTIITKETILILFFILVSLLLAGLLLLPHPFSFLPIALVFAAVFVLVAFKFPMIGILGYLFFYFFKPQEFIYSLSTSGAPLEKAVGLVVILSLLLNMAIYRRKKEIYFLDYAILGFLVVVTLSMLWAEDITIAKDQYMRFFPTVLVYFFVSRIADDEPKLRYILWLYALSVAFIGFYSTINYYRGIYIVRMGIARAIGPGASYSDPNSMAASLILGIPFIFNLIRSHRSIILKLILFVMLGVCIWTVVLTGSRSGMISTMIVLMILGFQTKYKTVATIVAVMIIAGVAFVMPEQYVGRFESIFEISEEDETGAGASAMGRVEGLMAGLEMFMRQPLTGVGVGNFRIAHRAMGGPTTDAHNLLGKLVGELGLLGLITFTFFIVVTVRHLRFIRKKYKELGWREDFVYFSRNAIIATLIMLFIFGISGHNLFRYNWYISACYALILFNIVERKLRSTKESPVSAVVAALTK